MKLYNAIIVLTRPFETETPEEARAYAERWQGRLSGPTGGAGEIIANAHLVMKPAEAHEYSAVVDTPIVARICHEAVRALCRANGDESLLSWGEAPEWQRVSAFEGVLFCRNNPNAPSSAVHDDWLRVKKEGGWVYGPVKDADKKEHPCIVPYAELPEFQRRKDALFKAIVVSLS